MQRIKNSFLVVTSIVGMFSLEVYGQKAIPLIPGLGPVSELPQIEEEEIGAPVSGTTTIPGIGRVRSSQSYSSNQAAGAVSQQTGGGAAATVLPFLPRGTQSISVQTQQIRRPAVQTQSTSQTQARPQVQTPQIQARQQVQASQLPTRQQIQTSRVQTRQQIQVPPAQERPQVRAAHGPRNLSSLREYIESQVPVQRAARAVGRPGAEESKIVEERENPIPFVTAPQPVRTVSSQSSQRIVSEGKIPETERSAPGIEESFYREERRHQPLVTSSQPVQTVSSQSSQRIVSEGKIPETERSAPGIKESFYREERRHQPLVTSSQPVQTVSSQSSQRIVPEEKIPEMERATSGIEDSFYREERRHQSHSAVVPETQARQAVQQQHQEEIERSGVVVEQQVAQQRQEEERRHVETQRQREQQEAQEQQQRRQLQAAQAAQEAQAAERRRVIEEKRGFFLQEVGRVNELDTRRGNAREEAERLNRESEQVQADLRQIREVIQVEQAQKTQIGQEYQRVSQVKREQEAREQALGHAYRIVYDALRPARQRALDDLIVRKERGVNIRKDDVLGALRGAWAKYLDAKAAEEKAKVARDEAQQKLPQFENDYRAQEEKIRVLGEREQEIRTTYTQVLRGINPAEERARGAEQDFQEQLTRTRQELANQTPEILRQLDPATSSKSLRQAELYEVPPIFMALGIHGEVVDADTFDRRKDPHERWVAALKNKVDEKTRLDATAPHNRTAGKEANRDRIIAQLHDTMAFETLKRQVYGDADARGLSYAQKGALIKAYLGATGRDPLKDQTWNELPYIKGEIEPAGLLSNDEAVAQIRACHDAEAEESRRAAEAGGVEDPDFDC